jgi:hypothetical protein
MNDMRDDSLSIGEIIEYTNHIHQHMMDDPYKTLTQIMDNITVELLAQQAQIDTLIKQIADMRDAYSDDMHHLSFTPVKPDTSTMRALHEIRSATMQSIENIRGKFSDELANIKADISQSQKITNDRLATLERETRGMFLEYSKRHRQSL